MGIAQRYVEAAELIVTVWDGSIVAEDWIESSRAQATDPNWSPSRKRLTDVSSADTSGLVAADVQAVTGLYRDAHTAMSGLRLAIVASAAWELARETERLFDPLGVNTIVFTQVPTACTWLGVDSALVLPVIVELREQLRR